MSEQVNFVVEHYDNDTLAEANEQLSMALVRLHTENAKLRELVRRTHACKTDEGFCEDCYQDEGCCPIERDMQELGIGVDDE